MGKVQVVINVDRSDLNAERTETQRTRQVRSLPGGLLLLRLCMILRVMNDIARAVSVPPLQKKTWTAMVEHIG